MRPVFQHDCALCVFRGHFFGHDVYTCTGSGGWPAADGPSLIARYGDEGSQYASTPLRLFRSMLSDRGHEIEGTKFSAMPYQDWVFSPHGCDHNRAFLVAFTLMGLDSITGGES